MSIADAGSVVQVPADEHDRPTVREHLDETIAMLEDAIETLGTKRPSESLVETWLFVTKRACQRALAAREELDASDEDFDLRHQGQPERGGDRWRHVRDGFVDADHMPRLFTGPEPL